MYQTLRIKLPGVCFLLLVCLLAACEKVELQPIPESGTILAFGDSLTAGVGTQRENSYPAILTQLSGRTVVNAGISGEVTAQGVARFPELLDKHAVDLVILIEGGNDILRNQNLSQTKDNLAAMIETAQKRSIDVVLVGVPEKSLFSAAAPLYDELAEEYQLVYERDLLASLLKKPKYKSDSIHFNAEGYRLMAERLYERLQEHGAL